MLLVFAVYLLLCLPVIVGAEVYVSAAGTGACVFVSLMGVGVRTDLRFRISGEEFRVVRLYEKEERDAKRARRNRAVIHCVIRALTNASQDKRIEVSALVGTGDAAFTALATGVLQAAAGAAAARWSGGGYARVRVAPVYGDVELCLHAAGIFRTTAGDIIRALLCASLMERCEKRRSISGKRGSYGPASD